MSEPRWNGDSKVWMWFVRAITSAMIPVIWSAYAKLSGIETSQAVQASQMLSISIRLSAIESKVGQNEQDEIKRLRRRLGE